MSDAFGERFFVEPAVAEQWVAIVGGIVACAVGAEGIPSAWLQAREPLPNWRR